MASVLFIDDDQSLLDGIARSLRRERFQMTCCTNVPSAREHLRAGGIDVVVCDENMPGASGSDFLSEVRESHPTTMRILLTGHASVGSAARAINGGQIFRMLMKPCGHHELAETIREAFVEKELLDRCRAALRVLQRQNGLLLALERLHPGLIASALSTTPSQDMTPVSDGELAERVEVAIVQARTVVGE